MAPTAAGTNAQPCHDSHDNSSDDLALLGVEEGGGGGGCPLQGLVHRHSGRDSRAEQTAEE